MNRVVLISMVSILGFFALPSVADNVDIPNAFSANTPAVADEVNANFNAVETAVDDNDARITQLESQIATLQSYIDDLQAVIALQNDNQGNPSVVFSGVNVHINNGEGTTDSTPNGLGNLVIGYDEDTTRTIYMCSIGQYNTQVDCTTNNGAWETTHKSGSHNVVLGSGSNYSSYGGLVAGYQNSINSPYASATGGRANLASGNYSSISGGESNTASGESASITGGFIGYATASNSTISGGYSNDARGSYSSVSGGSDNTANGISASISGGSQNSSTGVASSVSGGNMNTASGTSSSVSGGESNLASGDDSTVSGGYRRSSTGHYDWRAGTAFEDL